jgi:DNA-binding MarR family transcriptional regulator
MAASARRLEDPPGSAFLLAALGAHAAARFAERIAALDVTPAQTGLLRAIAATPGQSQQVLAQLLGTPPSRLVGLVDSLADRGLVERRRNPTDRRLHALHLTADGATLVERIETIGREHDDAILRSLKDSERARLRSMLARIAEDQGLTPGVHPSYRRL